MRDAIRFGVVGIHGYSRAHIGQLRKARDAGEPVRLALAVAHDREADEAYAAELEAEGVALVPDLETLLARKDNLDLVTLPVGIPLHVPMAEACLGAGLPTYLEKPVAGTIQEVDRLVAAEAASEAPLFIGYQHLYQPDIRAVKKRLLDGALGGLRRIVVAAAWPRHTDYYARNRWAGRLRCGETVVLDSPLNNACAHYMNLALFLAGAAEEAPARPLRVRGGLYRAKPIESADTASLRVETAEGVEIVYNVSHACALNKGTEFRLEGDTGAVVHGTRTDGAWIHEPEAGKPTPLIEETGWVDPLAGAARALLGKGEAPRCTLAMARPHTLVVNGAHLAAPIRAIPDTACEDLPVEGSDAVLRVATGMNGLIDTCFEKGCLFHETALAPWAGAPGRADVAGLRRFELPQA